MAVTTELSQDELDNLKLRLALEGLEAVYGRYTQVITLTHPQHGMSHFTNWQTVRNHCNENWVHTRWGPSLNWLGKPVHTDLNVAENTVYFINDGVMD